MESIGIRELRQHASQYLRRVAAGEAFSVTDRGNPVGELIPHKGGSRVEEMLARGELVPPERPSGALHGNLPEPLEIDFSASGELERLRNEERW